MRLMFFSQFNLESGFLSQYLLRHLTPISASLAASELVIPLLLCLIPERLGVKCLLQQHLHTSFRLPLKEKSAFGHLSSLVTWFHSRSWIIPFGRCPWVSCSGLQVFKIAPWFGFFFPVVLNQSLFWYQTPCFPSQVCLCGCSPYPYLGTITCFCLE